MVLLSLAKDIGSIRYLGIYVGITAIFIVEECCGDRETWKLDASVNEQEGNVCQISKMKSPFDQGHLSIPLAPGCHEGYRESVTVGHCNRILSFI